jgi:Zn-finger nucleic acid-binding protein
MVICSECKAVMIALEFEQVEIDYCPACGAVWLDSGELEILFENAVDKRSLLDSIKLLSGNKEKRLKCPICRKKMTKAAIGDSGDLIIDKCIDGHGFWLNKGELESVLLLADKNRDDEVLKVIRGMFVRKNNQNNKGG